ncbi:hypothetical protein HPB47_000686 [Ixodes persulcatus]|uniref:Uncharacterized protein n=1 Tax=Ixodes persulcatus TaxID=34615 RepID=A0AC60PSB8_IXOPE|nr:hypothetical protein HPB47_000686 [Ixodes persulcatus]
MTHRATAVPRSEPWFLESGSFYFDWASSLGPDASTPVDPSATIVHEGSFSHVCYYTASSDPANLPVFGVDVRLCTHVIMGFVLVNPAGNLESLQGRRLPGPAGVLCVGEDGARRAPSEAHAFGGRRNVDFVNLMTYDLHIFKWYTPLTGHNSPLFSRSDELGYFATLNVQSSTELWTSMGMPKSKIMVGIPTYGLSWVLLNAQSAGVGSVAVGQSKEGDGFVSYPKTRWILAQNFSGTMTFSLNSDDWQGTCGHGAFPLQKSILEAT